MRILELGFKLRARESKNKAGPGLIIDLNLKEYLGYQNRNSERKGKAEEQS